MHGARRNNMNAIQHQEMILTAEKHKSKAMLNDIQKLLELCYKINEWGIDGDMQSELQHIMIKYDIKKEV
jgi:hypothetical protein